MGDQPECRLRSPPPAPTIGLNCGRDAMWKMLSVAFVIKKNWTGSIVTAGVRF